MTELGLSPRMMEALSSLAGTAGGEWESTDTVHDSTIIALEERGLVENDMTRHRYASGALSRSYVRISRLTDEGLRVLMEETRKRDLAHLNGGT